jgi:hypothetical protein
MSFSSSSGKQDITSTSELPTHVAHVESVAQSSDATSKVLGTDELFLLIVEKVPVHDRLPLLRVSKKWNYIVSSVGYAFDPTPANPYVVFPATPTTDPRYELDVKISINPAINSSAMPPHFGFMAEVALENVSDPTQLLSRRREFITSPPITTITLGLRGSMSPVMCFADHTSNATLREKTGIRIGLLLDMFDKMRAQALRVLQNTTHPLSNPHIQPLAFFYYSGVTAVTYQEEGYVELTFPHGSEDDDEDQESTDADSEGRENDGEGKEKEEDGEEPSPVRRPRRSEVRCSKFPF